MGVEKGISSADSSVRGSLLGHGGNYSRDSGKSVPQERGCGTISALAHRLCRSLRMPAAEKPFFSFNHFSASHRAVQSDNIACTQKSGDTSRRLLGLFDCIHSYFHQPPCFLRTPIIAKGGKRVNAIGIRYGAYRPQNVWMIFSDGPLVTLDTTIKATRESTSAGTMGCRSSGRGRK
jgi:hypothetical protein